MIDFERDTSLTNKMLDALDLRVRTSMHNIANQNTPGYKRQYVRFEDMLKDRLAEGKPLDGLAPVVERDMSGEPEQNTVSIVDETATLEKARLLYDVMSRRAGSYFKLMNASIFGR